MHTDDEAVEIVPSPAERYDDGVVALDTLTGGMDTVTAGFLLTAPRPALIECGPAKSIASVIAGLRALGFDPDDLAYVVLTHIHLDHAGGAGDLAAAFPNARIVVSEVGAPHLHEPARLNVSSRRVYGALYDEVYGDCTPIERDRLLGVDDGDRLDLGGGRELELLYTPGHAKHHVGVHDSGTGAIFSGDSVGVKLPGMTHIRPATPPADFHLEAALRSLARYREREPSRVYLAHYGPVDPPDAALAEAEDRLRLWAATAESAYRHAIAGGPTGTELDHVAETLQHRFASELDFTQVADDPHAEDRIELLSGYTSNAAGLVRYFQRRDEGTLTDVG
ncbi:MBL fold metallo-hydrolase [Egicoccus sp. AB-alg2]|uniref:MBL fold metallo-hydrolase n=1 Tax=Egicoccus sp. AB-alg2 TaxID=3242693 RepID=UPI00359E694B